MPRIVGAKSRAKNLRLLRCFLGVACFFLLGAAPESFGQSTSLSEYQLKAAFLFNFAKFIDWPAGSFASPQAPLTICVIGKDPFGHALDETLADKRIEDRPLTVVRLRSRSEARLCQIVFVSSSESENLSEIIDGLRGAHVLLVGETPNFATAGGAIEFTIEDGHVRFTINTDAADRAGLRFSSKLLALAKLVHDDAHSKGG